MRPAPNTQRAKLANSTANKNLIIQRDALLQSLLSSTASVVTNPLPPTVRDDQKILSLDTTFEPNKIVARTQS